MLGIYQIHVKTINWRHCYAYKNATHTIQQQKPSLSKCALYTDNKIIGSCCNSILSITHSLDWFCNLEVILPSKALHADKLRRQFQLNSSYRHQNHKSGREGGREMVIILPDYLVQDWGKLLAEDW